MAGTDPIMLEIADRVAIVTLNRPERLNALSPAVLDQLDAMLGTLSGQDVGALVITGAGRAFCSGADLLGEDGEVGLPDDLGQLIDDHYIPLVERLWDLPLPVIAAVNGIAAGAGCSLALCADLIVAGSSASFIQAFANIGLVPDAGSTWILPRMIGRARAMEMMMLGDKIPAEQALAWGLVNRVVEDDRLLEEAVAMATRLARGPSQAYGLLRKLARKSLEVPLGDALALERDAQRIAGRTEDFKNAVESFVARARFKKTGGA
jgi:2-(1,2-epoxy-1,2-dihydrophenyl)acetyl-CoA isomerase